MTANTLLLSAGTAGVVALSEVAHSAGVVSHSLAALAQVRSLLMLACLSAQSAWCVATACQTCQPGREKLDVDTLVASAQSGLCRALLPASGSTAFWQQAQTCMMLQGLLAGVALLHLAFLWAPSGWHSLSATYMQTWATAAYILNLVYYVLATLSLVLAWSR